jgi:hypothetical protein
MRTTKVPTDWALYFFVSLADELPRVACESANLGIWETLQVPPVTLWPPSQRWIMLHVPNLLHAHLWGNFWVYSELVWISSRWSRWSRWSFPMVDNLIPLDWFRFRRGWVSGNNISGRCTEWWTLYDPSASRNMQSQEVLTDICHTFLNLNRLLDVLPPRHIHSFRSPRSVLILYCTSEHVMAYENAMWLDLGACVMKLAVMWRSTQKERSDAWLRSGKVICCPDWLHFHHCKPQGLSLRRSPKYIHVCILLPYWDGKISRLRTVQQASARLTLGTLPYMQVQPIVHAPLISRAPMSSVIHVRVGTYTQSASKGIVLAQHCIPLATFLTYAPRNKFIGPVKQ